MGAEAMPMNPKELKDRVKGVIHLVMSPFDEKGDLDTEALKRCVNHVAQALEGNDAVFVTTASTGEFYAMTDEECRTVMRVTVEEVAGRFPVFGGTGRSGTRRTIELSRYAQEVGADGVMVLCPYYQPVTEDGLYRHFKSLAGSIDIGIMIYNNPYTTKLWIPPHLMARLSKIPNIIANKENTADVAGFYFMQRAVDPADMVIVCGIGQLVYPFFALLKCPGFVTEFANFAPDTAVSLYKAAVQRDFDKMLELTDRIAPYYEFRAKAFAKRSRVPTVAAPGVAASDLALVHSIIKEAMTLIGLPGGTVREPLEKITAEEREQLRKVLQDMGVL
jgi:4-hydroxy-tetrahydrodipicolinate synthase